MKGFISILIIGGLLYGVWKIWEVYDQKTSNQVTVQENVRRRADGTRLPGMDPGLENAYSDAMQGGVLSLKAFLQNYRNTSYLTDPRLAWIEIDYALLLRYKDPLEANRVFQTVKARSKSGHAMVQDRIRDLEGSFK